MGLCNDSKSKLRLYKHARQSKCVVWHSRSHKLSNINAFYVDTYFSRFLLEKWTECIYKFSPDMSLFNCQLKWSFVSTVFIGDNCLCKLPTPEYLCRSKAVLDEICNIWKIIYMFGHEICQVIVHVHVEEGEEGRYVHVCKNNWPDAPKS